MAFYHPNIHRCEHIKANGTQCGSPSLRRKKLCFFHDRWQAQRLAIADSIANIPAGTSIAPALNLPVLEDANSIQVAIMQILPLLLTGQLPHKTAALALYALQLASSNLRRARFEPYPHDVVINPATVSKTRMGEEIWKNSDFNARGKHAEKRNADNSEEVAEQMVEEVDEELAEELADEVVNEEDGGTQDTGDENEMSDELPPNWRDEICSQIAARLQHTISKGIWTDEMIRSSKSGP